MTHKWPFQAPRSNSTSGIPGAVATRHTGSQPLNSGRPTACMMVPSVPARTHRGSCGWTGISGHRSNSYYRRCGVTNRSYAEAAQGAAQHSAFQQWQEYISAHAPRPVFYATKMEHLEHAVLTAPAGQVAEFGVDGGHALRMISACRPRQRVWGFDAWHHKGPGLPDRWTGNFDHSRAFTWTKGSFRELKRSMPRNVRLVPGLFDAQVIQKHLGKEPLAVLHIDCDTGASTRTVLDAVVDLIKPGTRVIFDEYCNYPGWREHEHLAWKRFCSTNGIQYHYWGQCHMDVSVEVISR